MRALPVVVAIALAACARAPDATASKPAAPPAAATPAPQPGPEVPPPDTPSPGPSAKRAPPQPGELVSPVVAFRAEGPGWSLRIENTEGYAHDVALTWDGGRAQATGKLDYQPEPSNGRIVLQGQLDTPAGPDAMVVEIAARACTDARGVELPHEATIDVAGMPRMRGCGELAK
jgi:glucose/arabinose dehydrogenase